MSEVAHPPAQSRRSLSPLTSHLCDEGRRCQRALERNPRDPEALVGMSLIALASNQPAAAVGMAQAAVTAAPAMGPAWVALGQAMRADGRLSDAEQAYEAAIRIDGMDSLARLGLGEVKLATDRPAEALPEFELALRRDPSMVSAHLGMGHALAFLTRYDEALPCYERALELRPRLAEAEFAAGYSMARLARPADAARRYRRALVLRPAFAAAWLNLGCLLRDEGQDIFAQAALERAVELCPTLVAAWINLAILERESNRMEKAEAHLRRALMINPQQVETHVAWAQLCAARGDTAGAWGWLRWALARDEKNDEAVNMMGILLHSDKRFAEAVAAFEDAEALGSAHAASNRGNSLLELGRMPEALAAHHSATGRVPQNAGARYNLALTQLRLGDWRAGWRNYESRWRFHEVHRQPRRFDQPRWHGEGLRGQRVLLHAEQGLGDTIQFCRYAALIAARGGVPVLQVQPAAERLVRSLAAVRAGHAEVTQLGIDPPPFDLECPLMSLPAVFGTTVETVPWCGPYLAADPDEITRKNGCGHNGASLRAGIAWAGNPRYKADAQRSMHLTTLLPLLRTPGVTWFSLQKGPAAEQIAALSPDDYVVDGSSRDVDLAETAALVATLDVVISTDTCIAHLAGAMGKSVWILLPHLSDWRWMQDTETTPWYPTARLFRQSTPGDWAAVLARASAQLRTLVD
jgi:tetratricopeptide (TPR) repeat protein